MHSYLFFYCLCAQLNNAHGRQTYAEFLVDTNSLLRVRRAIRVGRDDSVPPVQASALPALTVQSGARLAVDRVDGTYTILATGVGLRFVRGGVLYYNFTTAAANAFSGM